MNTRQNWFIQCKVYILQLSCVIIREILHIHKLIYQHISLYNTGNSDFPRKRDPIIKSVKLHCKAPSLQ